MPVIANMILKTVKTMLLTALTERLVKQLIVSLLEEAVKKTDTKWDDKLLAMAKREWGM